MSVPKHDIAAIEARLRARRAELEQTASGDEGSGEGESMGRLSPADTMQDQAMAMAMERRREIELARVDSALERLAEGEYGRCVTCAEEIDPRRLELDPATPLCLPCARRAG